MVDFEVGSEWQSGMGESAGGYRDARRRGSHVADGYQQANSVEVRELSAGASHPARPAATKIQQSFQRIWPNTSAPSTLSCRGYHPGHPHSLAAARAASDLPFWTTAYGLELLSIRNAIL